MRHHIHMLLLAESLREIQRFLQTDSMRDGLIQQLFHTRCTYRLQHFLLVGFCKADVSVFQVVSHITNLKEKFVQN